MYLEFFPECLQYNGPHDLDCLESIWNMTECIKTGAYYPSKLTAEVLSNYAHQNIRFVMFKVLSDSVYS